MSSSFPLRRSYLHRGGDQPLIGDTIDAFVRAVMRRHAARDAVVALPQTARYSYQALNEAVDEIACGLVALGLGRGDRLGIWATNNAEWVMIQFAAARIGVVLVNLNPAYRAREMQHALRLARADAVIVIPAFRSSRYPEMIREVCPEVDRCDPDGFASEALPDLKHLIVFDPDDVPGTARPFRAFHTWSEMIERGLPITPEDIAGRSRDLDPDDPINIQFTSGTTGSPKAVVLTHHNLLNNGWFVAEAMGFTPLDRLCVPVPFYHCFGMVVSNLACLTHGSAIVIPSPHFDAEAALTAVHRERCTALHGVPTMFVAELEHPEFRRFDLSSLRTGVMGGAPCPPELMRRVIEEMGCREICCAYGQTESSPITQITRLDDSIERRVGTVGTNLPHQEVKLVDPDTGEIVPLGVQGEICFRGYHVMRGYYGQARATSDAIDTAGWLHSGDLGELDEHGYLRITGRLKDMIIRGGENIYPAELEAFFFEHPKIAEVAVFGVPDDRLGEEVGVWIKLHDGMTAEPDEFIQYSKGQIAHYKIPRHIWIVDEFPMTATGKVQKFRIREIVAGWLEGSETGTPAAGPTV